MTISEFGAIASLGFCLGFLIGLLNLAARLGRRGIEGILKVPGLTP